MSCSFEENLTAFVDRELSALESARVEQHLPTCAECRKTEALLRRTVEQLAAMPAFEPSTAMRRQVLARVDAEPQGWVAALRGMLRPTVLVPSLGFAAAVAIVGVVALRSSHHRVPFDPHELDRIALAENMEVVEDMDLAGVTSAEDLEIIEHLHEVAP